MGGHPASRSMHGLVHWCLITIGWLVLIGTLLYFYPRYRAVGDPLFASDFESPIPETTKAKGNYSLVPSPENTGQCVRLDGGQQTTLGWYYRIKQDDIHLRLRFKMRTQDIQAGPKAHEMAIVSVYMANEKGKHIGVLPNYGFLSGTHPFQSVSEVLLVTPETRQIQFLVRNLGQAGTMWIDDLSLQPVRQFADYYLVQAVVWITGLLLGIFWTRRMGLVYSRWSLPTLMLAALVVYASVCPRTQIVFWTKTTKKALSHIAQTFVGEKPPPPAAPKKAKPKPPRPKASEKANESFPQQTNIPLSKKGHAFFFGLLALSASFWCWRSSASQWTLICALALLAVATEILQIPVVGRSPRLTDWFLDIGGMAVGLALARLGKPLLTSKRPNQAP